MFADASSVYSLTAYLHSLGAHGTQHAQRQLVLITGLCQEIWKNDHLLRRELQEVECPCISKHTTAEQQKARAGGSGVDAV
jgi:hypothetical protein